MIKNPSTTDLCGLCDWAESQVFLSGRNCCTRGDIIKYIQPDDVMPEDSMGLTPEERDESIADDVLSLLLRRSQVLSDLYPFVLDSHVVRLQDVWHRKRIRRKCEAYLFFLLLSVLNPTNIDSAARHDFEIESLDVLHDFFGGYAFHFGWTILNTELGKASSRISAFCEEAGKIWRPRGDLDKSIKNANDLGIDCIVWKQIADNRENAFVVLGQCASGENWDAKLSAGTRKVFTECLESQPSGPTIYAFSTPYQIPDEKWRRAALTHEGVLFDRIRLVLENHAGVGPDTGVLYRSSSRSWLANKLRLMSEL